jgi:hypothetical protein
MSWRPEGWRNPYTSRELKRWRTLTFLNPDECFEAGADVMFRQIQNHLSKIDIELADDGSVSYKIRRLG